MRKTTSTAAALRFRRTSCRRRWSSGYKSRRIPEEENGPVPFRRTEAVEGCREAFRS
jgi:hypothetical protein